MKTLLFAVSVVLFSSCYYHHGEEIEVSEIFKVVEAMPTFPGCDSILYTLERNTCSDLLIEEFIAENLIYPEQALQERIEGEVIMQFIVEDTGELANIKVVRNEIGGGCGRAALELVKLMPNWNPGRQRGRAVKVQFNLLVEFKL